MSSQSDATTVPEVPGTQLPARAGQASHGAATLTLQLRGKRQERAMDTLTELQTVLIKA
jgi:hypothetical protein